jgi:hypothetical protein
VAGADAGELVTEIVAFLAEDGFVLTKQPGGDGYVVDPGRGNVLGPVLTVPPALFREYLEAMSRTLEGQPDPFAEALSLTRIHLMEELGTDHGDGRNYVRALGYRRRRDGSVEFYVDKEIPDRGQPPPPSPDLTWQA